MQNFFDKYSLKIALFLPLMLIVLCALIAFLPLVKLNPSYNLVYAYFDLSISNQSKYGYLDLANLIDIKDGKIILLSTEAASTNLSIDPADYRTITSEDSLKIYSYNFETAEFKLIPRQEALELEITNAKGASPDGYFFNSTTYSGGNVAFFFDLTNNYNQVPRYWVQAGILSRQIDIHPEPETFKNSYDYWNRVNQISFIGWSNPNS
jgi:hypothetical protein